MRRRRDPGHGQQDRWLISYADFITLLFAFFVSMYAMSLKDRKAPERVSASVRQAVSSGGFVDQVRRLLRNEHGESATPAKDVAKQDSSEMADLDSALQQLRGTLRSEITNGQIHLQMEPRGLVITLQEQGFFPSGEDGINESAMPSIARVAAGIAPIPNPLRLEGHTDSQPVHGGRFHNNWELSTARSIGLLNLLQSRFGIQPGRFSVAGFADTSPVAGNDTAEGRARNRRVEIVLLRRDSEPAGKLSTFRRPESDTTANLPSVKVGQ